MYCEGAASRARITSARLESAMIFPPSFTTTRWGFGSMVISGSTAVRPVSFVAMRSSFRAGVAREADDTPRALTRCARHAELTSRPRSGTIGARNRDHPDDLFHPMADRNGMTCPRCQADNPEGTRFCGQCGTALVVVCPACGTHNPPT